MAYRTYIVDCCNFSTQLVHRLSKDFCQSCNSTKQNYYNISSQAAQLRSPVLTAIGLVNGKPMGTLHF